MAKIKEDVIVQGAKTAGIVFTVLSALCTIVFGSIEAKNGGKTLKGMLHKRS